MGGLVFADVRDHTGLCQIVSDDASTEPEALLRLRVARNEWVVAVTGVVRRRKDGNDAMPTGDVEIVLVSMTVLNTVDKPLPFSISGGGNGSETSEEVRLKHRVLDLRRPAMRENLRLRANTVKRLRNVLEEKYDFMEIETPLLTRSTPEGARDYLVPSRLQPGNCYALPQSPQLFKQMLMVSGVDRYYQVARCFRDEDLRADRQPEFTQLDIEMAFTDMEGILEVGEDLMCAAFKGGVGVDLPRPFVRMTYAEAMRMYGSDKPDLRYGLAFGVLNDILKDSSFALFADVLASKNGVVKALAVPEGSSVSNSRLKPKGDVYAEAAKGGLERGFLFCRVGDDGVSLEGGKALCEALLPVRDEILRAIPDAGPGSLLLFAAGEESAVNKAMDRARQFLARRVLGLIPGDGDAEAGTRAVSRDGTDTAHHAVLWITEFPMFEMNVEANRLEALHHPFTAPNQDDVADGGDIKNARAVAYDLVYNGVEVGGGSLRVYRRDIQEQVFQAIGLSEREAEEKFGYLMEAFQFGAPPHGGMAFGLDRLVMLLAGATSIRDVVAFPKTATAQCLLTQAPGSVSDAQLADLHVQKKIQVERGGEVKEKAP
jgi:aspartyl-tRNA synthetase